MGSYFAYLLVLWAMAACRMLPRGLAGRILDQLAAAFYLLDARHRHIARVNLTIAFPNLTELERDEIARRSFQTTARNLLEVSWLPTLTPQSIGSLVQYDPEHGLENYELARAQAKGLLYLTGHFSAWELLPAAHALYGHPLAFVTRPLDNVHLDRQLQRIREACGNSVIPKRNAAREILERLKAGGAVGILVDQNTSLQEGVFADLFGIPAATTTGLALFSLRTEAAVLPGYLTPAKKGRYTIKFLPPVELVRSGDRSRDLLDNTNRFNRIVEGIIREQPESWLWGHKRWKNQPPGNPPDLYSLPREELQDFLERSRARSVDTAAGNCDHRSWR